MKNVHESNRKPPDMTPTSLTSKTYQTISTIASTRSSSNTITDVLYIKHSVAIAGLNKFDAQATNTDIAEFANVFCTMFDLN